MAEQEILLRLVLALGMGLLVGFQRESSFGPEGNFAGVRTFALTGFLGFACGHFSLVLDSPLPLCAGLLVSAALAVVTFLPGREGRAAGTTTEAAGESTERRCPNCGAPLSVNESAKCPYCDTVLTFQDHDWTIYAVKGIAQRTVQS